MTDEIEKLSLVNLKEGAAVEMFDNALDKVMDNINDPNTTSKAREIKLVVKFIPSEDRSYVAYSISCDPKLMSQEPEQSIALVKTDNRGHAYAVGHKSKQAELPFANVHDLKGKKNE